LKNKKKLKKGKGYKLKIYKNEDWY
jgi:hypothetical protein